MPRKRPADFRLLIDLLRARDALGDWEVVTLEGRPEDEVAAELRRAALFVALGREEGFGLPVAEALASGCPVVGFHGMGGRSSSAPSGRSPSRTATSATLAAWIERFVGRVRRVPRRVGAPRCESDRLRPFRRTRANAPPQTWSRASARSSLVRRSRRRP